MLMLCSSLCLPEAWRRPAGLSQLHLHVSGAPCPHPHPHLSPPPSTALLGTSGTGGKTVCKWPLPSFILIPAKATQVAYSEIFWISFPRGTRQVNFYSNFVMLFNTFSYFIWNNLFHQGRSRRWMSSFTLMWQEPCIRCDTFQALQTNQRVMRQPERRCAVLKRLPWRPGPRETDSIPGRRSWASGPRAPPAGGMVVWLGERVSEERGYCQVWSAPSPQRGSTFTGLETHPNQRRAARWGSSIS